MQTRFEHHATTSMLGEPDSPPRENGSLHFDRDWEGRAFGIALALSKQGRYEWDEFRRQLMASIAEWESQHPLDDQSWDYYERWLIALERLVIASGAVSDADWEARTEEIMASLMTCKASPPEKADHPAVG